MSTPAILYVTEGCHACEQVKDWLMRHGVAVVVRNVAEDWLAHDELTAMGFWRVPVTLIAGRHVVGFDETALRLAVAAAGT